jgi:2-hydroxy-6-oxonona-2,4-dienedioate hydrolase
MVVVNLSGRRARPSKLNSIKTQVGGGVMHAEAGGAAAAGAPLVILIHGLVVSSRSMIPAAESLAVRCRVYAPDLPGYGRSYKPASLLSLAGLADGLARWMEALNLSSCCLAGNSFGCQVIAEFALRHPDKTGSIVLQGPTVDPEARTLRQQIVRLAINSRREQRSMGPVMVADYWAAGVRRVRHTIKLALTDKIEEKLPRIRVPALVIRGERDPLVPQDWAEEVARLLPNGTLRVIPKAAHTINYSQPGEFAAAIENFLGV